MPTTFAPERRVKRREGAGDAPETRDRHRRVAQGGEAPRVVVRLQATDLRCPPVPDLGADGHVQVPRGGEREGQRVLGDRPAAQ